MRKIFVPLLLALTTAGCSPSNLVGVSKGEKNEYDYVDFKELELSWENVFSPAKSQYFIYIYSLYCGHCSNIKNDVLTIVDEFRSLFYLINYSDEIPVGVNASETIGKEKIEEIYILGTPTLLEISDKRVVLNIAGETDITNYLKLLPHNICT